MSRSKSDNVTITTSPSSHGEEHQLDEFGRDVGCARKHGEPHSEYAERVVEHINQLIDEAELRIIDLEGMRDIASTYGPSDDEETR